MGMQLISGVSSVTVLMFCVQLMADVLLLMSGVQLMMSAVSVVCVPMDLVDFVSYGERLKHE